MHYDAVIFDFGGVVTTSPFSFMQSLAADAADGQSLLEVMLGPYDQDTDHPFHRLERGEMPLAEYGAWMVGQLAERGIELRRHAGGLQDSMRVHPETLDVIRGLRADGYRTGLLTNNVAEERAVWRAMVPLDELFDVVVDSSEVGMRKPDGRIYALTLRRLGVSADRAVFLDDAPGNVAGARSAGLTALLVGEPVTAALGALRALLETGVAPPIAHAPGPLVEPEADAAVADAVASRPEPGDRAFRGM